MRSSLRSAFLVLLRGFGLLALGAGAALIAWLALPQRGDQAVAGQSERRTPVVDVVQRAAPGVVNISTDRLVRENPFSRDIFGFLRRSRERRSWLVPNSLGTGVIVDPRGYVLTNYHVIEGAYRVMVTLSDGRTVDAEAVGADPSSDLFVLKLKGDEKFPWVPMGTSGDLLIGETVVAIGNPFGLGHTVTTGVVSALNRSVASVDESVFTDFVQTDASINPGNSGGPLLNIDGEIIGINTAIRPDAEGIGFAIPIDRAKRVLEDLVTYGGVRPLWLGMEVRELTPRAAQRLGRKPGGVIVTRVYDESPAAEAGVEPGDEILQVEGSRLVGINDWRTRLSNSSPGDELELRLARGERVLGGRLSVEALTEERSLELAEHRTGLALREPSEQERRLSGLREGFLVVRDVREGSPAARVGFRSGDLIVQLQDASVGTLEEYATTFSHIWDRDAALLLVSRRGTFYRVPLEMT